MEMRKEELEQPEEGIRQTDGQFWNTVFEQPVLWGGYSWGFAGDCAESASLECWSLSKTGVAQIKQTSKTNQKPVLKDTKPINVSTTKGNCSKMKNFLPQNSLEKLWLSSALSKLFSVPFWWAFLEGKKIILGEQCISSVKLLSLHWESDAVTNPKQEFWNLPRWLMTDPGIPCLAVTWASQQQLLGHVNLGEWEGLRRWTEQEISFSGPGEGIFQFPVNNTFDHHWDSANNVH